MGAAHSASEPRLLLVDDDLTLCRVLARALRRHDFNVTVAHDVDEALHAARVGPPAYAVIDLKLPGASGLTLIQALKSLNQDARIVVLTSYASISTTVEAIKLGATNYLAKPADADEIAAALQRDATDAEAQPNARPLSPKRLEWEHIQKVLNEHDGNVSATARALGMHLRTLQRKLAKRPVKI